MTADRRSMTATIDIAATPDEVWAALTQAQELTRWFSLSAEVQPGVGGFTKWAWDDGWVWASRIERWEPGRVLGLLNEDQRPFDADGQQLPAGQVAAATLGMVFTLETHDGTTRLTLIHSGFGQGAAWDDEYDGVSVGWRFEFRSLKHYLERHRGRQRRCGVARVSTVLTQRDAWQRLIGSGGLTVTPWPVHDGDTADLHFAGDHFSGPVLLHIPERDLSVVAAELGDGIARVGTHQALGRTGVSLWIASYAADQRAVTELRNRWAARLHSLFPE